MAVALHVVIVVLQVRCQACLAFRNLASEGTHTFNHMYSYVYIVKVRLWTESMYIGNYILIISVDEFY